jgi:hypothetical protein
MCSGTDRHVFPLIVCGEGCVHTLVAVTPSKIHIYNRLSQKFDMGVMSSDGPTHFHVSVPLIPAWTNLYILFFFHWLF